LKFHYQPADKLGKLLRGRKDTSPRGFKRWNENGRPGKWRTKKHISVKTTDKWAFGIVDMV